MTLESTTNKSRYVGNGTSTKFPFSFRAWKTNQVQVFAGDGAAEQDVTRQCSISLTASGGTVIFASPPASGTVIVIRRKMPYIQEDDYKNGARFDSEEIEDRFDQDCAERQDLKLDVDRALKVPLTSRKASEEYLNEFWDAIANAQELHAEVSSMYAEIMSERPVALQAIKDEGDRQVERVQNVVSAAMTDTGNSCMEISWTLAEPIAANSDIDISPLFYFVGRHHMRVGVNGVQLYRGKGWNEKGSDNEVSHIFTTLLPLNIGDTVNVWITHLVDNTQ